MLKQRSARETSIKGCQKLPEMRNKQIKHKDRSLNITSQYHHACMAVISFERLIFSFRVSNFSLQLLSLRINVNMRSNLFYVINSYSVRSSNFPAVL